jgi:GNAT superfamily N-acetyltransferase
MIRPLAALDPACRTAAVERIEDICLASSGWAGALGGAARAAFFDRWAGGYLERWPELTLVHGADGQSIDGYLVGCADSGAASHLFDDQFYYRAFAAHYRAFPAHFHINVAPGARNRGVGAALLEAFAALCRDRGCSGVHLVTGARARNRAFYSRNGFEEVDRSRVEGDNLVLLGRRLAGP